MADFNADDFDFDCHDFDKFDDVIYNLYQQCPNGIHEMIDAIFYFLARKTTFFTCYPGQEAEDFFTEKVRKYLSFHKLATLTSENLEITDALRRHLEADTNDTLQSDNGDFPPITCNEVTIAIGDSSALAMQQRYVPPGKQLVTRSCEVNGDVVYHSILVDDERVDPLLRAPVHPPVSPSGEDPNTIEQDCDDNVASTDDSPETLVVDRGCKRKIVMTMKAAETKRDATAKQELRDIRTEQNKREAKSWRVVMKEDELKVCKVRKRYSNESMMLAYNAVVQLKTPLREAARMYNVPTTTLSERVNGKRLVNDDGNVYSANSLFEKGEEESLVRHVGAMSDVGYPCSGMSIRRIAMEYAIDLGRRCVGDTELSDKWLRKFRQRHPGVGTAGRALTDDERLKCAMNYFAAVSEVCVGKFLLDKPENVFCVACHEVGEKGAERKTDIIPEPFAESESRDDDVVTLLYAANARGIITQPYFIFPGGTNSFVETSLSNNSVTNANGRLTSNIFASYYNRCFSPFVAANAQDDGHVIVVYDAATCHIPLSLLNAARERGVYFVSVPLDTKFHPLHKTAFNKFDQHFRRSCKSFSKMKRRDLNKSDIADIARKVLQDTLTVDNIQEYFRKTGAYPLNASIAVHY